MTTTTTRENSASGELDLPVRYEQRAWSVKSVRAAVGWLLNPANGEPLSVFVLTRFLFLVLTYFGVILYSVKFQSPHPSLLHQLLPAWQNRWDTQWYTDIARRGYHWTRAGAQTAPAAFFPLYPLLIHVGVVLTHRSYILVALAISNVCFLVALGYLWRLTRWEFSHAVAGRTILYIATFPTALFFFAGYTESLFLLLTVASFFHLRRRDWLLAGLFGGLASATRVTGILLIVPFAYEYGRHCNFSWRRLDIGALGLLLIPTGLVAFMLYLHRTVGDALGFSHDQAAWEKVFTPRVWEGIGDSLRQIFSVQPAASFFQAHNIINLTLGLTFLVGTIFVARNFPWSYTLYLIVFWLLTLSNPALANGYPVPLVSLSRYVLSLFPVFMYLGIMGRKRPFHDSYLVLSVGMLALLTIQFIHGGWVV
jgi:Mannosyltransferase (PIG-V)